MFSKDSENLSEKNSNRDGGLETASAQFTELQYTASILFVNRSKISQKKKRNFST